MLAETGVDAVVALRLDAWEFAASSPEEFLARTFGTGVPAHLHVGLRFPFRRESRRRGAGAAHVGRWAWHAGARART